MRKAIVALARRLAVIMHSIWVDGTEFPIHQGRHSSMKVSEDFEIHPAVGMMSLAGGWMR
jgi:hypothetical protein